MDIKSRPIVVLFGYKSGKNRMVFVGRNSDIKFEMRKHRENLIRVLALCDGYKSLPQIRDKLPGLNEKDFQDLVNLAEEFGIIRDSRELYISFHEDSANPLAFAQSISPDEASALADSRDEIPRSQLSVMLTDLAVTPTSNVLKLCSVRKSSRSFTGEYLTLQEVSSLLRTMYTVSKQRSTPSAGQLYPLDIYVAVTAKGEHSLSKGLYRYDPTRLLLNLIEGVIITPDIIARILNSHQAEDAALVVFIAADLQRPAAKYANRGYRFALMEAGHVAQNAHLYCAETKDLGMVEFGGFQDKLTSELLGLNYPKQAVLLAIIVGKNDPTGKPVRSYFATAWNLSQQLIGKDKPIEYVYVGQPADGKYKLPRIETSAKYRKLNTSGSNLIPKEERFGSGLAVTSDESMIKALAEAYERYASGIIRIDKVASATTLDSTWLDPREIVPLQSFAYQRYNWLKFDPQQDWQWVAGKRHNSGETVMVPIDLVFYPLTYDQLGRMPCFSCTSNGVAAHIDQEVVYEKALLELIERDAISVTWYTKRGVSAVPVKVLPEDIQLRMRHWTRKGWQVKFLNLTLDSVPVVLAMIYSSNHYPSFVAGGAASINWHTAITKAWDEAEIFLLNWRRRKRVKPMTPQEVYSPLDHGRMYFREENLNQIKWLLDAEEAEIRPSSVQEGSELLRLFNPVLLDLTPVKSVCDLKVVRTISEHLMPINFGYGNEHVGHKRLSNLGMEWKREFPSFPHFFA